MENGRIGVMSFADVQSGENAGDQPELTFVLQSEYRRPLGMLGADWFVSGLFNWNDEAEVPGDSEGRFTSDSYYLLDLYAGLDLESWSVKLGAKNVMDEAATVTKRDAGSDYNDVSLVAPRTTGVTVSWWF